MYKIYKLFRFERNLNMAQEITIKIEEAEADKLMELDAAVSTKKDVLATLFDMHSGDNNTKLVNSPMVEAYQTAIQKAQVAFSKAQDDIINKYIDVEEQKKVTTWSINYSKCELVYVTEQ